jgi:hypothetical protein
MMVKAAMIAALTGAMALIPAVIQAGPGAADPLNCGSSFDDWTTDWGYHWRGYEYHEGKVEPGALAMYKLYVDSTGSANARFRWGIYANRTQYDKAWIEGNVLKFHTETGGVFGRPVAYQLTPTKCDRGRVVEAQSRSSWPTDHRTSTWTNGTSDDGPLTVKQCGPPPYDWPCY